MKKALKAMGSIALVAIASGLLVSFLHDTALRVSPGAFAPASAPAPPLSTSCTMPQPNLADCTVVLSSDPAAYGATVAAMRGELLQEWCTGLARRTDGARGDVNVHLLYPNRAPYADFQIKADECQ